jgi:hypothetical protein
LTSSNSTGTTAECSRWGCERCFIFCCSSAQESPLPRPTRTCARLDGARCAAVLRRGLGVGLEARDDAAASIATRRHGRHHRRPHSHSYRHHAARDSRCAGRAAGCAPQRDRLMTHFCGTCACVIVCLQVGADDACSCLLACLLVCSLFLQHCTQMGEPGFTSVMQRFMYALDAFSAPW